MKIKGLFKQFSKLNIIKYFYWNFIRNVSVNKEFYTYKNSIIQMDKNAKLNIGGRLHFNSRKLKGSKIEGLFNIEKGATLNVTGDFSIYYGSDINLLEGAVLNLGSGFINANCQIRCCKSITIGNKVAIGRNFFIQDSDFHTVINDGEIISENVKPVIIGDHVWIGTNVTVLKGVTIGNHSVVAAGSVITKDVPEHSIVAGVPAKVIRQNVSWR